MHGSSETRNFRFLPGLPNYGFPMPPCANSGGITALRYYKPYATRLTIHRGSEAPARVCSSTVEAKASTDMAA